MINLNQTLKIGLQQGRTVTEIAVQLHNQVGNTFNNVIRLVRSETMHYLNSATLEGYKARGVTHVRVIGAVDDRTCEICLGYRDKIYPIEKVPVLPFHPNCRCTFVPEVDIITTGAGAPNTPEALFSISNSKGNSSAVRKYARELKQIPQAHREIITKGVEEILFINDGASRFDRKKKVLYLRTDFVEGEAVHEMAHVLETVLRTYKDERFRKILKNGIEDYTLSDIVYLPNEFREPIYAIKHDKFVSAYQGRLYEEVGLLTEDMKVNIDSLGEYFSEGYREYLLNPKGLKERDRLLYEYIDKIGV